MAAREVVSHVALDGTRSDRSELASLQEGAASVLGMFARDRMSLRLETVDLCFLALLHVRADRAGLPSFEEDVLLDDFEQACDLVEPGAENPRLRATRAIQRLRDQRMLARVDGAGVMRSGEYALTRLAAAIVEYYLSDDALTREVLTRLTATLSAQLTEVLAAARKAVNGGDEEQWRRDVVGPLRVTVSDLVAGIERRQRGLDAQQETVQGEIARLLTADWFGAVESCQDLLDTTTATLRELNSVLMRDTSHFVTVLQEIQGLAESAARAEAEAAAQRTIAQVDRIAAWGLARQRAWSEYYQYVHRYLRDVVRLDPGRALSQRLREQAARWVERPFYLQRVDAAPLSVLRRSEARVERPPVTAPRIDRDAEQRDDGLYAEEDAARAQLEALAEGVASSLMAGADSLAAVTRAVLERLPSVVHYLAVGRIADQVARVAEVKTSVERPWRGVTETIALEDWSIAQAAPRSST